LLIFVSGEFLFDLGISDDSSDLRNVKILDLILVFTLRILGEDAELAVLLRSINRCRQGTNKSE